MSHEKVVSLLEAASSALSKATYIMKDYTTLPLPPSPISPSVASLEDAEISEYMIDEAHDIKTIMNNLKTTPAWSVPGTYENGVPGHLADVAVGTRSYGFSIGRMGANDPFTNDVLGPLGYCRVSPCKFCLESLISVGDILYTHNTKKVFRGVITDQPIKGPFCSIRSLENSFTACLGVVSDEQLRTEVEIVFKVDWTEEDDYDEYWENYLQDGKHISSLPRE